MILKRTFIIDTKKKKIMYWFKRKYWQIKRVIEILPLVWNSYDFDYHYAINLFKFQLGKVADFLDSNKAWTVGANERAQKIRTAIRLMDKVYNDEYGMEYLDKVEELYGRTYFDRVILDRKDEDGNELYRIETRNEFARDKEHQKEIDEISRKMMLQSMDKQKRAHKLLWEFIEHNIQGWWD